MDRSVFDRNLKRETNLLYEGSRSQIINSLKNISEAFQSDKYSKSDKIEFFQESLIRALLPLLAYSYDSVREKTLILIESILSLISEEEGSLKNEEIGRSILIAVFERISTHPFKEEIEEIRLKIVNFLIEKLDFLKNSISSVQEFFFLSLSKILSDKFPESKKKGFELIIDSCSIISTVMEKCPKDVVLALSLNLRHSHWRVRQGAVYALTSLLSIPSLGCQFDQIKSLMYEIGEDKNREVRLSITHFYSKCLLSFELEDLKRMESDMISSLLYLVEDQDPNIKEEAMNGLIEFSERRKNLFDKFNC